MMSSNSMTSFSLRGSIYSVIMAALMWAGLSLFWSNNRVEMCNKSDAAIFLRLNRRLFAAFSLVLCSNLSGIPEPAYKRSNYSKTAMVKMFNACLITYTPFLMFMTLWLESSLRQRGGGSHQHKQNKKYLYMSLRVRIRNMNKVPIEATNCVDFSF